MPNKPVKPHMMNKWHVATAAEAMAAAQLARCGWDVSVQYGANQPEYDLIAANANANANANGEGDRMLKVSVKGSKDGSWGLTQSHLTNADYHAAVDGWLAKHSRRTIFCLVQFRHVNLSELPRMYLAWPEEIGAWLKAAAAGRGDTVLYEEHAWSDRAAAAGTVDRIPDAWRFTEDRLNAMACR